MQTGILSRETTLLGLVTNPKCFNAY